MDVTRKEYEKKYNKKLSSYSDKHEDNIEPFFWEIELENYTNYCNSLLKISDYFKNKTSKDRRVNAAITDIISDLKKINEPVFNEIFTIEKTKVATGKVELDNGFVDDMIQGYIPGKIEVDYEKLTNHITSAKRILMFISDKLMIVQEFIVPENDIDASESGTKDISVKAENPHPRIFKSYDAFTFFEKLMGEFRNTVNNLSNYSFVYHKMMLDDLIYQDIKQLEYFDFLATYDIHISRIKSLDDIGKKQFRESIYASAK